MAIKVKLPSPPGDEISFLNGKRRALISLLAYVLHELGTESPETGNARWLLERTETVSKLREICAAHGDNDWPDELHLADVLERHLLDHLESNGY